MTILSKTDTVAGSDVIRTAIAGRVETFGGWISEARRRASEAFAASRSRQASLRELSRLDDHSLRDIGVDRADLPRDPVRLTGLSRP